LRDVLENVGVKPHFKEVSYEMKYVEDNYDMHWHNNREEFTYKSWWTYLPVNDAFRFGSNYSSKCCLYGGDC